ncbi:MAG: DUF4956 domain-containing protein [Oscillospiraceae bacterium]|nr:DUF4956 domain-containing protein [Oscillospiraceae bacterium]
MNILSQVNMLASLTNAGIGLIISLICGIIVAVVYRFGTNRPSKFMIVSTLIVPAIVQVIIMMVNGNIGAGVAAAGAFSLVRFRSIPGSSRDICMLFLAMASGLVCGMGFMWYALIFTAIIAVVIVIAEKLVPPNRAAMRQLKIVIPEDMDYSGTFDEIFKEYTNSCRLDYVRTIRMGTMYELVYIITCKAGKSEKEMLDKIRCRNGNLTVSCGIVPDSKEEL